MKKYICFMLFSLFCFVSFGQKGYEHRLPTAIDLGTHDRPFTFTDIERRPGDFTDDFHWDENYKPPLARNDIFYRITLTGSLAVKFKVTRTGRCWTNIFLLDDMGKRWEYRNHSNYVFGLTPGVYYFVVEGEQSGNLNEPLPNDTLRVQVEGVDRTAGEDFSCPLELGSFSDNFNLTPKVKNMDSFRNDYRSAKDVRVDEYTHDAVFHFTLEGPMTVSLKQNGRSDEYDYSQSILINAAGDTICVSNAGDDNVQQVELPAGEYYIYGWCRIFLDDGLFSFKLSGTVPPWGSEFFYAVEIGSHSSDFTYTDTRNTSNYPSSKQPEKAGKEAYYRFTLVQPMEININTCGSAISDTYLKVFSSNQKLMFFNDDYSGAGACSDTHNACIRIPSLIPGTYYIVTDAASSGNLTTTVTGTVIANPGNTPDIAIDLGTHDKGFTFSDIRDTSSKYTNNYTGKPTFDVYYKFTLTKSLDVTINHEGSTLSDTYLSLLDQNRTLLKASGNANGWASLEFRKLPAGVYYVVSEGINGNGAIKTSINILGLYSKLKTTIGQPHVITLKPIVETDNLDVLRESELVQEVQYFNHLGLPTEKILHGITPGLNDLIILQEYDGMNRETKQWLPAVVDNAEGVYIHPNNVQQAARDSELYGNDSNPYTQIQYDGSQLGRITKQFGAGKDWQSVKKSVNTDYLTNSSKEVALIVKSYSCTETLLTCSGDYVNGALFGVKTTDEDSNVSFQFKDKVGRLILSRQMNGTECLDTYYVYDKAGNLRFVLPPLAADALMGSNSWNEDNVFLKKYAYIYKYDVKNRCIYKRFPGCEPVYIVYDATDRAIFTQDGRQRDKGEWTFSIPDAFGRTVLTGTCNNVLNYASNPLGSGVIVKGTFEGTTDATKGYVVSGLTLTTPVVLTASYFDSYDFIGQNGIPSGTATAYEAVEGYGKRYDGGCRGLQTGTLTARLSKTGLVTGYLYSVMYYDERYRLIQQKGNNELNGSDQMYTAYSFTGQPTQVKHVHTVPGKDTIIEIHKHTYDHADRLLRTVYQLNNDVPVTLADNVYDEVGRLKTEHRNGNSKLRTDYAYNVRSWIKNISGPLFTQTLYYQEKIDGNTPCYNGNISSLLWKVNQAASEVGYRFTYDGANRMKNAVYGEGVTLSVNPNRFNEQITAYDKMGNILGLLRYGQISATEYGLIDNLNLTYNGNQLQSVKDNATHSVYGSGMEFKDGANESVEYTYDKNGNLTKDLNKNISAIEYNLLNLPSRVFFGGGNAVEYEYGADGSKLRTVHVANGITTTTDYCGNAIYENGSLKLLLNETGYVSFPDKKFHFYLKDHLGSVRVVADKDGNVEEANSYYPFGGLFATTASVQPYKYNGKELDRKNGLDWYDYGARYYDAILGKWYVVDRVSEKYYRLSPYAYCVNNPLLLIDPNGMWPTLGDIKVGINNVIGGTLSLLNGTVRAVGDNLLLGSTSLRETGIYSHATAYNLGQDLGDVVSILIGGSEVVSGLGEIFGGGVAAPETVGVSLVVSAKGVVDVTHGSLMATSGAVKLFSRKGRVKESGKRKGVVSLKENEFKTPKSGSGKEKANNPPDWVKGEKPYKGEDGKSFAKRLMEKKYGKEHKYTTGPDSEFNKIKKYGDRSFE